MFPQCQLPTAANNEGTLERPPMAVCVTVLAVRVTVLSLRLRRFGWGVSGVIVVPCVRNNHSFFVS